LDRLDAGGSTAGGAGLKLAYDMAQRYHVQGGNNRIILATAGDFNVGASSDAEMVRLIEDRREEGTFLTVMGFGTSNLQDAKMEKLADHGNGNFAYIDTELKTRKTLVTEFGGTLRTIAKDLKVQVEFNPTRVRGYRLIGYENRMLAAEDFDDDTKDAGDLGAGHTVTALYEVIPTVGGQRHTGARTRRSPVSIYRRSRPGIEPGADVHESPIQGPRRPTEQITHPHRDRRHDHAVFRLHVCSVCSRVRNGALGLALLWKHRPGGSTALGAQLHGRGLARISTCIRRTGTGGSRTVDSRRIGRRVALNDDSVDD